MVEHKLRLNIHISKNVACFFIDTVHFPVPVAVYIDTEDIVKIINYNWQISKAIIKDVEYITVRDIKAKIRLADIILGGKGKSYSIGFKNGNIFDFRKVNIYYK